MSINDLGLLPRTNNMQGTTGNVSIGGSTWDETSAGLIVALSVLFSCTCVCFIGACFNRRGNDVSITPLGKKMCFAAAGLFVSGFACVIAWRGVMAPGAGQCAI